MSTEHDRPRSTTTTSPRGDAPRRSTSSDDTSRGDASGDTDLRPLEAGTSLGELVARLGQDLGDLMSTQVELAKVELRDEAKAGARAGGLLAAGGVVAHLAVVLLLLTAAFVLDEWLDTWAAFGIVTVVVAVVAAVLILNGRTRLRAMEQPLPRTRETLADDMHLPQDVKEDLTWTAPRKN